MKRKYSITSPKEGIASSPNHTIADNIVKINNDESDGKTSFEDALKETGFGLYNVSHAALTGLIIIGYTFVAFSSSILVPASACELETTVVQQGLLAAMPIVGGILSGFVWGYLGDTRGRRSMLLISLISSAVLNLAASLSVNWIMLLVLQFITTLLSGGKYSLSMTLISESVPAAYRSLILLVVSSIFLFGQGLMAVLAIPIIPLNYSYDIGAGIHWNSWRTVMAVYSLPSIIAFFWLFAIKESPKFVFSKGNEEGALEILKHIHRLNKGKSATEFQIKALAPEYPGKETNGEKKSVTDQIVPLFKSPLLKGTILMSLLSILKQNSVFLIWLPTIANQYVAIIQSGSETDMNLCSLLDMYINEPGDSDVAPCAIDSTALIIVFLIAIIHSLMNLVMSVSIEKTGRRNMVIILMTATGFSGVLVNLVPNAYASGVFFVILTLGILSVGLYTAITVAIFPTHLRSMAVALTLSFGRIAAFISVQILNYLLTYNCQLGFYLFSAIIASSSIVALFLPKL